MPFFGSWTKRKPIKYGTVKPGSNLTDFPVLLKIVADSDIGAALSSRKFAVTASDGTTQIPYGHYNDYNESAGAVTFTLRFKASPSSSASTGDVLGYLYYDNAQTDQSNRSGVLDSNYVLFAPYEEDPSGSAPQIVNWTGSNNGTANGSFSSGDLVAGKVGYGLTYNGTDDYIDFGTSTTLAPASAMTGEVIFKADESGGDSWLLLLSRWANNVNSYHWSALDGGNLRQPRVFLTLSGSGTIFKTSNTVFSSNAWTHAAFTYDGSTLTMYLNGAADGSQGSLSGTIQSNSSDHVYAGQNGAGGHLYKGIEDELSISSVARSADWLAYSYQNSFNNSDTVTLGAEETSGGATRGLFRQGNMDGIGVGGSFFANPLA